MKMFLVNKCPNFLINLSQIKGTWLCSCFQYWYCQYLFISLLINCPQFARCALLWQACGETAWLHPQILDTMKTFYQKNFPTKLFLCKTRLHISYQHIIFGPDKLLSMLNPEIEETKIIYLIKFWWVDTLWHQSVHFFLISVSSLNQRGLIHFVLK